MNRYIYIYEDTGYNKLVEQNIYSNKQLFFLDSKNVKKINNEYCFKIGSCCNRHPETRIEEQDNASNHHKLKLIIYKELNDNFFSNYIYVDTLFHKYLETNGFIRTRNDKKREWFNSKYSDARDIIELLNEFLNLSVINKNELLNNIISQDLIYNYKGESIITQAQWNIFIEIINPINSNNKLYIDKKITKYKLLKKSICVNIINDDDKFAYNKARELRKLYSDKISKYGKLNDDIIFDSLVELTYFAAGTNNTHILDLYTGINNNIPIRYNFSDNFITKNTNILF